MNFVDICEKYQVKTLYKADLSGADLYRANLIRANLTEANLSGANLSGANLSGANLYRADLLRANLIRANLTEANLLRANLTEANLLRANLSGANLHETCLDPDNKPNREITGFQKSKEGLVIGYRTQKAGHIDKYRVGQYYSADWFSTAETECHPGLYLWPTLEKSLDWSNATTIKVRTREDMIHKAGNKWRCKWFEVLEIVK